MELQNFVGLKGKRNQLLNGFKKASQTHFDEYIANGFTAPEKAFPFLKVVKDLVMQPVENRGMPVDTRLLYLLFYASDV